MKKLKNVLLGGLGLLGVLVTWGLIEPYVLNTEEEVAVIPNLPSAWEGKKIGQISDFQVGMWADNPETARRAVKQLVEENPSAVLISGDFIYHAKPDASEEIEKVVSIVKPLIQAQIPTYAVLGNHDYGMSDRKTAPKLALANQLETQLESAGVMVLQNEVVPLKEGNDPLYLVGVGSRWADRDKVDVALKDLPASSPRIALMHNPDTIEYFPENSAPLAVAGHTHGGQIRIPGLPQWSWLRFTKSDEVHADGWAKGAGKSGNRLYVNPGIGMSMLPIRLFCPPEVTIFTLKSPGSRA